MNQKPLTAHRYLKYAGDLIRRIRDFEMDDMITEESLTDDSPPMFIT